MRHLGLLGITWTIPGTGITRICFATLALQKPPLIKDRAGCLKIQLMSPHGYILGNKTRKGSRDVTRKGPWSTIYLPTYRKSFVS